MDRRSRLSSIRDEDSGASTSELKSPLPTPKFFTEQSFSAKKDRTSKGSDRPPPTPRTKFGDYGSCSSISRLFSEGSNKKCALNVSFQSPFSPLSTVYDPSNEKLYFFQCFDIIAKIGSGSFGDVFKVRSKEDGKFYAIKRSKQKFAGKADRQRKLQEVQKHELLPSHPNCVKFYRAWEERQLLYIQIELCDSSLSQYADTNHNIPEKVVWTFLIDLLLAVKHLHDHNLVHLDIKPDNIFISKNVCKLGDFGLILDLSKSDVSDAIEGDPRYLAPELMQGVFTKAADIFSLGVTILELASDLDLPKGGDAWHQLRNLEIPEKFVEGLTFELIKVITLMMEPDYTKRPSADDILIIGAIDEVLQKRRILLKLSDSGKKASPSSKDSKSSDWGSSLSDDVFEKDSCGKLQTLNTSPDEWNDSFTEDMFVNGSSRNNFESRARIAMSTPCNFRYWDSRCHDTSGSPCLSNGKKKGASPGEVSPPFTKSPRLQLFNGNSSDEDDLASENACLPPKNLLSVFNSLSPPAPAK